MQKQFIKNVFNKDAKCEGKIAIAIISVWSSRK